MDKGTKLRQNGRKQYFRNMALAAVTGQVGCFATLIYIAAVLAGLWLDNQFDTRPILTITLLVASLPVTIFFMFKWVRWTTSRMTFTKPKKENSLQAEEDIGKTP